VITTNRGVASLFRKEKQRRKKGKGSLLGSVGEGHLRRNGGEEELSRHRLCTPFPWLKGKQSSCFFLFDVSLEAILAITVEEGELPPLVISMYTDSAVSCCRSGQSPPALFTAAAVGTLLRRARRTGRGGRPDRSVLEAQRWRCRRVGLDEDGPEDLHVLAGARLDVLVQDVDAPLCEPVTIHKSETIARA
jgi:hypothetical protein